MKAKVKATGQIIELNDEKLSLLDYARGVYRDTEGNKFHWKELEFIENKDEKPIDWEQRRYEIAKDMMAAFLSNSCSIIYTGNPDEQAKYAVIYADALIAELKKGGVQ